MGDLQAHSADLKAAILGGAAGIALIHGAVVMTLPHAILGATLYALAGDLDRSRIAHCMVRAACLLLILATIGDGVLLMSGVYDHQPSINPFRPKALGYAALWALLVVVQAKPAPASPRGGSGAESD